MATATKQMLYRLLYSALVEVRAEGHDSNNTLLFLLADLFHNVPLQLEKLDRGEISAEDIMQRLRMRAQRNGIEGWLELRMEEEATFGQDRMPHNDLPT